MPRFNVPVLINSAAQRGDKRNAEMSQNGSVWGRKRRCATHALSARWPMSVRKCIWSKEMFLTAA